MYDIKINLKSTIILNAAIRNNNRTYFNQML